MDQVGDTIAAISTPPGEGGIGIVRVSGPNALQVTIPYFVSATQRDIESGERQVYFGEWICDGETIDEVLVHVMREPHSYTAEDVVEINCHGGQGPLNAVLASVLEQGARLAGAGEFTQRAFLNGRIDLVQAEAVMDRIQAVTRAGLRAASAAARGQLSQSIHSFQEELVVVKAHLEAAVDFPEDDLDELITPALKEKIDTVLSGMRRLYETADAGRLYREGATVVIAGRPNVGKSSLFNALLRDARAIVTRHAGTTRDVLEELITIDGIPVRLRDVAGIRDSEDEIEQIGVDLARTTLSESDVALFVIDASESLTLEDHEIFKHLMDDEIPVIVVANKADLPKQADVSVFTDDVHSSISVSTVNNSGLHDLEASLANLLMKGHELVPDQGMITRVHQKDSLRRSIDALERLQSNYEASPEFMSIDMDEALSALGEITGETTPDDILGHIFSSFCIGK